MFEDTVWEPYALLVAALAAWTLAGGRYGIYDKPGGHSLGDDLVGVAGLMTVCVWALVVAGWLAGKPDPDLRQLLAFWAIAIAAATLARLAARGGANAEAAVPRRTPSPLWPRRAWVRKPPALPAVADGAALLAVFVLCHRLVSEPLPGDSNAWSWVLVVATVPAWVAAATALGHYEPAFAGIGRDLAGTSLLASCVVWLLAAISPVTGEIDPDIPELLVVWASMVIATTGGRVAARAVRRVTPRRRRPRCNNGEQ